MSGEKKTSIKGSCLCGGVIFEVRGKSSDVSFCHCKQCRTWHGNYAGYTGCDISDLVFVSDRNLTWYHSSDVARRGFCKECGSSLFWDRIGTAGIGIAAGCLENPTGLKGSDHIFTGSAGDYYTIDDGLPQFEEDPGTGV